MLENNNIERVVDQCLCTSCGTCVYVCPSNAVRMKETSGGLLIAEVNKADCNACGLCLQVCPGDHLSEGILHHQVDPFKGRVLAAFCGKATNSKFLQNGQSGGIATALLCFLLDVGIIQKALVTDMPENGSLRTMCRLTADKKQIIQAQGSKYCPVALNSFLPKTKEWQNLKFAVVGLPCHFHGLRNFLLLHNDLQPPLLIGLICERIMSFAAIDYLIEKSGFPQNNVNVFRYRDKLFGGWPGNVSVKSKDNKAASVSNKHRYWCKAFFTPLRCHLCFDKMNIFCDIMLGDAWGVKEEKEGCSVILARTAKGLDIIEKACKAGVIQVEEINPEAVFKGQHIGKKRRDWTIFTSMWKTAEKKTPDFGIQAGIYSDISKVSFKDYQRAMDRAKRLSTMSSRDELLKIVRRKYLYNSIIKQPFYFIRRVKNRMLRLLNFFVKASK